MLALAILTVLVANAAGAAPARATAAAVSILHLTTNEIRHLLNVLILQPAQPLIHYLRWSSWRRAHQALARRLHYHAGDARAG